MAARCIEMLHSGLLSPSFSFGSSFSTTSGSTLVAENLVLQPYGRPKDMAQSVGGNQRALYLCRSYSAAKGGGTEYDCDLYELLGLDNGASQNDIRSAYRWLQKRCHPDIVGEAGHDMSILLNEAYAVLSDPNGRAIYDEVRKDAAEFDGFTGEPLYSVWSGAADEQQAVFVDESRCIGCLKCALLAPNTFAIENRYGRARAVRQWGDSEATIKDACRACPVDCIWWVDRSQLPALEFVMSKQIRVSVGVDVSNGGVRSENVFEAAEKFAARQERREKQQSSASQETTSQRAARMSAAEGIRARGGRWWQHWIGKKPTFASHSTNWDTQSAAHSSKGALVHVSWASSGKRSFSSSRELQPESLHALYEAAAQRRRNGREGKGAGSEDEYWVPKKPISWPLPYSRASTSAPSAGDEETSSRQFNWNWIVRSEEREAEEKGSREGVMWNWVGDLDTEGRVDAVYKSFLTGVPVAVSSVAAVLVGMTNGTHPALSQTQITGPLPADLTTSLPMQMFLAAIVWYAVGSGLSAALLYGALVFVRVRDRT